MMINEVKCFEQTLLVKLEGEIDLKIADTLRKTLDDLIQKNSTQNLILNLAQVSFIDSSGLGVILGRYKKLVKNGGTVAVVQCQPQVKRIVELSGLLQIMNNYSSDDEAISQLG